MPKIDAASLSQAFRFLAKNYFRSQLTAPHGLFADSANERAVIYIANHSGMAFSWDAHILREELRSQLGARRNLVRLVAPDFFRRRMIQLFGIEGFRPLDGVPATRENFSQALVEGQSVLIFPEGVHGISKGFDKRYQIQRISSSVVRMALQHRADIVMIAVVNGEYLNPHAYRLGWVNNLARRVGLPFLPIGLSSLYFLIFPWGLYGCMPARLRFVCSRRIRPDELLGRPPSSLEQTDESHIQVATRRLRLRLQTFLAESVQDNRESGIYEFRPLIRDLFCMGLRGCLALPPCWPVLFQRAAVGPSAPRTRIWLATLKGVIQTIPIFGWPLFIAMLLLQDRSAKKAQESTELSKTRRAEQQSAAKTG